LPIIGFIIKCKFLSIAIFGVANWWQNLCSPLEGIFLKNYYGTHEIKAFFWV
jgi:hypothetical protein